MFLKSVICLFVYFCLSQAAKIIPLDSSIVNVKSEHGGKDYSYSIHENHAVAVESEIIQPALVQPAIIKHELVPALKALPISQAQEDNEKNVEGIQDGKQLLEKSSSSQHLLPPTYLLPGNFPSGYPHGYTYFYRLLPVPVLLN